MYKEVHLRASPVHRHHRFRDNGALCGGHLIQYYAVTLIASDHRKMMSPQLLAGKTKKNLLGWAELKSDYSKEVDSELEEPQITHTDIDYSTWQCWVTFPGEYITCQGSKAF